MKSQAMMRGVTAVCLIFFYGCATTNLDRAERTTKTMEVVEKDINRISVQLNATEASLDHLLQTNELEIQEAFEAYQENVDKIINLKKNLRRHADLMRKTGSRYFTEWQIEAETYANPELRELSEKRRKELNQNFDRITQSSGKISRELDATVNHLKEVESYLSTDLTPETLKAITSLSRNIKVNGKVLKESINQIQIAINSTKPEMNKLARN